MARKQSKADIEKLVDAKARSRKANGQDSEKTKSRGGALDERVTKQKAWLPSN